MGIATLRSQGIAAAVFDLDGVVTRTARLHVRTWKRLFDELGVPFDPEVDYREHVDGRPRMEGLRTFLGARGICVPQGSPTDAAGNRTLWALAHRKNELFHELLAQEGAEVFPSAVALIRALREAGVRVGVATSSKNAAAVLSRAALEDLFEARVDGVRSEQLGLRGKPAPDIFLHCLQLLGAAPPARSAVFEDAVAGVEAGKAGGFGLVVGVDPGGADLRLREAGADLIVSDLGELSVEALDRLLTAR